MRVVATALQTVTPRSTRGRRSFGHRVGRAWRALAHCYPDDAFAARTTECRWRSERKVWSILSSDGFDVVGLL